MRNVRRASWTLCLAVAMILATGIPAQADAWYSGDIGAAMLGVFCTDGAEVTLVEPAGLYGGYDATFVAYHTPEPYFEQHEPYVVPVGESIQTLSQIGEVSLATTSHPDQPYKFSETPPFEYNRSVGIRWWEEGILSWDTLPTGIVVAVEMEDSDGTLLGAWLGVVTACRVGG